MSDPGFVEDMNRHFRALRAAKAMAHAVGLGDDCPTPIVVDKYADLGRDYQAEFDLLMRLWTPKPIKLLEGSSHNAYITPTLRGASADRIRSRRRNSK